MDFEPRLRKYLENLSGAATSRVPLRRVDAAELYRHLLERLRQLESAGDRRSVERVHREWPIERIEHLARYLEAVSSPLAQTSGDPSPDFATRVLDQAIYDENPGLGIVDQLELRRIANGVQIDNIRRYALENGLVVADAPGVDRVSALGRVLLRLRGRDAIQWLLIVELAQSTGQWDPWRTPRQLLEDALNGIDVIVQSAKIYAPYAQQTLDRLGELAVLSPQDVDVNGLVRRWSVPVAMVDLVHAVLEPGPWHVAVAALLEDERAAVVQDGDAVATRATTELTKLITHEVRNALVPARHHMDALRSETSLSVVLDRIDKARRGVVRVLDFVDKLVTTSDLIGEPATSCDVAEIIQEAISWTEAGERVKIVPGDRQRVRAPRSRLVRAIHNVLLNALQAAPPEARVRVSHRTNHDRVEVVVDDGGPGIPMALRGSVFDEGFTTRGGPGHGFGLAFVRSVVEGELRGKVWCEDSELGGARFVLAIAAESKP